MRMLKVKILGKEVQAALLNPEVAEKYDKGLDNCISRIQTAYKNSGTGVAALREQCNAVINYIDDVFGSGTSKEVFGEETDLITCLDAFEDMANLYKEQVTPLVAAKTQELNRILGGEKNDSI